MLLTKEFFRRSTEEVSKDLLGKTLVRETSAGRMSAVIVETEAYLGFNDPACHSYKGETPRNKVMFGEAGCYYVYFIYGMYYCLNLVTEDTGVPEAVLIRALMPLNGIDLMRANRPRVKHVKDLANGPGKLTVALNIDKKFNGVPVNSKQLYILDEGCCIDKDDIVATTRIGITVGTDLPLRFYPLSLAEYVSKK